MNSTVALASVLRMKQHFQSLKILLYSRPQFSHQAELAANAHHDSHTPATPADGFRKLWKHIRKKHCHASAQVFHKLCPSTTSSVSSVGGPPVFFSM